MNVPVLIAGGGPAGGATAIALRNLGIDCVVVNDGKKGKFIPGESLAPNTGIAMRQLNASHILASPSHSVYTGNIVVWGDDEERSRYFFSEPYGNGWHVDRMLFEQQIRELAEQRGAQWYEGWRITEVKNLNSEMHVTCTSAENAIMNIKSKWIIDCSGRASAIGRLSGMRKLTLDHLTAYCFILEQAPGPLTGISFIEAVNDGWWYAAAVNENKIVVNFMSDNDLHEVKPSSLQTWLFIKLHQTKHLQHHLKIENAGQILYSQIRTATTSYLEKPAGLGWLAAGDALCAYDPLTSFGITSALAASHHAAAAVKDCLNGSTEKLMQYISIQQQTLNKSLQMLAHQYSLEQRFKNAPFWSRRHS